MTDRHTGTPSMLLKLEDLQAWLHSTAALLRGCDRGLRLTPRDCAEMERLCRRAADIVGAAADERRENEQDRRRAAVIAEVATGGPPPPPLSPPQAHAVPLPEAGPNVVALITGAPRRGDTAS